jgi:hypothetical protein
MFHVTTVAHYSMMVVLEHVQDMWAQATNKCHVERYDEAKHSRVQ